MRALAWDIVELGWRAKDARAARTAGKATPASTSVDRGCGATKHPKSHLTQVGDRVDYDSHASIEVVEPIMTTRTRTDLARVFKALGDPTRLAIYEIVREGVDPQ